LVSAWKRRRAWLPQKNQYRLHAVVYDFVFAGVFDKAGATELTHLSQKEDSFCV
jgi:hypothetical protein